MFPIIWQELRLTEGAPLTSPRSNISPRVLDWMRDYRKEWLRPDVFAGLTTAAVVIPKAMAYATIAGLPVQVGLYTAFLPMLIYAALGASRPLSVSTTTTIAILTAAQLGQAAPDGNVSSLLSASAMLTLLVGVILAMASLVRLGFIANFISEPVLIGFKAGIGFVIVMDQIPKLLGIHFPKGSFFHNLLSLVQSLPDTSIATLAIGASMLLMLAILERFFPKAPAPLITVAAGIFGMGLLGWQDYGVASVGLVPKGLPPLILPDFSLAAALWPGALGIALMSFTETIAAGRAFANSDEPPVRANQELLATGAANIGGAMFGAMPAGGGASQTAVNRLSGARTQMSELLTAGAALVTMLLLAPLIGLMPEATLAAVVIVYSTGLIKPAEFRDIVRVRQMEFIWALAAFAGVIVLGTLKGILVAIVVSLVSLAYRTANPPVYALGRKPGTNVFRPLSENYPEDETFPGLLLIRVEGRIFFLNAERIAEQMKSLIADATMRVIALDLSRAPDLEYTALKMLTEAEKRQRDRGVALWLVGLNPEVLATVQKSTLGKVLGRERMFFNLELAVAKFLEPSQADANKSGDARCP